MQAQAQALSYERRADQTLGRPAPADEAPPSLIGVTRQYHRDQCIFSEGDGAEHVYRVVSGAVRLVRILADGRRQIEDFYLPGDLFGLELGGQRHATAEAIGETVLVAARRSIAAADPAQAERLWGYALRDLARSRDHMLTLGQRSATERLAAFLIGLETRLEAHGGVDLPMSRQDMADYLGLTIETVSRTLSQLQHDRVIELRGCRCVRFARRTELAELCD